MILYSRGAKGVYNTGSPQELFLSWAPRPVKASFGAASALLPDDIGW